MDGVGNPRSYGKYEIFDDEQDALSWEAAEKRAHEQLRKMGIPIPTQPRIAVVPPRPVHPELEEERPAARAPKPPVHKKLGEGASSLPPPPGEPVSKVDHKLEAIARAHLLLYFLRSRCCAGHQEHVRWIDEILDMAPKK